MHGNRCKYSASWGREEEKVDGVQLEKLSSKINESKMDEKYYANIFTAMPRKLTRRLVWKTSEYRFLPFLYDLKKERIENVYTCNLCENEINILTNDQIIIDLNRWNRNEIFRSTRINILRRRKNGHKGWNDFLDINSFENYYRFAKEIFLWLGKNVFIQKKRESKTCILVICVKTKLTLQWSNYYRPSIWINGTRIETKYFDR